MSDKDKPDFHDFQKEMTRIIQEKLSGKNLTDFFPKADDFKTHEESSKSSNDSLKFDFNFTPQQLKAELDKYVIQQEEAKKVLAVAICDHYNHVKYCAQKEENPAYAKQNILMIGPTGVGKTYLIRTIAELIKIPFVKADATKFSETGYVGQDVEDLVRELVQKADGDLELAKYGIIYVDEIDKIASTPNMMGKDVSGQGVQRGLLKLMEETDVPLVSPTDMASQFQSIMEMQSKGKVKKKTINTRHMLFIMSGAFDGITNIIQKRLHQKSIGYQSSTVPVPSQKIIMQYSKTDDFIKFGFDSEFIGRMPVRVVCDPLTADDLFQILKDSKESVIHQYEHAFEAYGIDVRFSEEALQAIAELACKEGTGARGLLTVLERTLRNYKYELPGTNVKKFIVNKEVIFNPKEELHKLVSEKEYAESKIAEHVVKQYAKECSLKYGVEIVFDEDAKKTILKKSKSNQTGIRQICDDILRDLEYALNLIKGRTLDEPLIITKKMIANPDAELEGWVKKIIKN